MSIQEIYKQLTNIDIEEQKQIWDERGKGYYGEYLLFCELYKTVNGTCKILMNLNVPVNDSRFTEIDLLMIHETGLYIFEIKHYKGTVYGKDTDKTWTQYFRTVSNNTFKNPIEQNAYHVKAIKRIMPDIPVNSVIVFTSNDCDLRVENKNEQIDICLLKDIKKVLSKRIIAGKRVLSIEDIDNIFNKLSVYSNMCEKIVIDAKEADFKAWVQPFIDELEEKKAEVEVEKEELLLKTEDLKRSKKNGIIANSVIAVICIILSVVVIFGFRKGYQFDVNKKSNEIDIYKQYFVYDDKKEYNDVLGSIVKISNVSLEKTSYSDALCFAAQLNLLSEDYAVALTEDTKCIVVTDAGELYKYDVFGQYLKYNRKSNILSKKTRMNGMLNTIVFNEISNKKRISYIKLTEVELINAADDKKILENGLEIELYSK